MPFIPENPLERALVAAVTNPTTAADFYRLLLESDLLVLGTVEGQENANQSINLAPGGKLNLVPGVKDGNHFLPVFSSMTRMQEYVTQDSKYLSIKGHALLDLVRGAPVTLNPASEYGKELSAGEVAQLLGALPGPLRAMVSEAEHPEPLVKMLTALFVARPEIEAAWMVQVTFPDRASEPHPLVGVETSGDWPSLMKAVQAAAENALPDMVFDIQRVDRHSLSGMADALLQTAPFYQRRAGALN